MENDKQPLKKVSISQHLPKSNTSETKPLFEPRPDHEFAFPNPLNKPNLVSAGSKPIAVESKPIRLSEHLPKVKEPTTKVKEPTTNVNVDEVPDGWVKRTYSVAEMLKPISDAEWDEINLNWAATVKASQRKKRPQKFNTTYCFNLSKAQLEALTTYAKFNNTSKSNCIRKAITEMLNKGRI